MSASVRIEDEAFSDLRFEVLAKLCGLADADHARGKMAKLWRQCTASNKHVLPDAVVDAVLGAGGAASLIEAELGRRTKHGLRIRGTKGRIEWLGKLRANGRKGGRPKKAKAKASGSRSKTKSKAPPNPPAPAPAPTDHDHDRDLSASPPDTIRTVAELEAASGVKLSRRQRDIVAKDPFVLPVRVELAREAGDRTRARAVAEGLEPLEHPGPWMVRTLRDLKARTPQPGSEHARVAAEELAELARRHGARKQAKRAPTPQNQEDSTCDDPAEQQPPDRQLSSEEIRRLALEHAPSIASA